MGKRQREGCKLNDNNECCVCGSSESCTGSDFRQSAAGTAVIEAYTSIRKSTVDDRTASNYNERDDDKPEFFGDVSNKDLGKFVKRGWWSR